MAQKGIQLHRETISCSICLDLLKDPVTIPCGHSYCMNCIKSFWDDEDEKNIHSCPQCRQTFKPRPVLVKSTVLANLVEELKKTELQSAPADHYYAESEDVSCDVCTGRKFKAIKSCLVCLVSYCEKHLQPHFESPAFEKHKLVDPSKKIRENICSHHNEEVTMFCHYDKQCICNLCSMDEHKGHDTVSVAAERTERQKKLEVSRQEIQQRIQDREKDVKLLQRELEAINRSADEAVDDNERIFTKLISVIQKRSSDLKQHLRSQQKTEVSRVKELQQKLEQEITELKKKDAELKQFSQTVVHNEFIQKQPLLSQLSTSTDSFIIKSRPLRYFDDVTVAVSKVKDKLMDILMSETWTNISLTELDILLPPLDPKTRDDFLKYSREITLDPNTAHTKVLVAKGDRKIISEPCSYSHHPDRFTSDRQVLSRESLTGRCYWEVEWNGEGVKIAVAYKNISRNHFFGGNQESWALHCYKSSYKFVSNDVATPVSGPWTNKIGVYLDHTEGILSFYSISNTMTLLHRVLIRFTQPLYAGLCLYYWYRETAEFCELK
ncbi:tripartite motif-containing protein 16 [Larimichthys crocea]|uniref:tripartite motif-containing protein 16 n=1 Tax=Larimichthys crocea TaxID=215358 RepID=UPI00090130E8|nr:tripartite motif-containing protein 16 [Larimichthys crocea]